MKTYKIQLKKIYFKPRNKSILYSYMENSVKLKKRYTEEALFSNRDIIKFNYLYNQCKDQINKKIFFDKD